MLAVDFFRWTIEAAEKLGNAEAQIEAAKFYKAALAELVIRRSDVSGTWLVGKRDKLKSFHPRSKTGAMESLALLVANPNKLLDTSELGGLPITATAMRERLVLVMDQLAAVEPAFSFLKVAVNREGEEMIYRDIAKYPRIQVTF